MLLYLSTANHYVTIVVNFKTSLTMASILIVDDHPAICFAVKAVLEQEGKYQVYTATDGMQAMSQLNMRHYHLVILDIALAKMDGLELLARIKHHNPQLPVVILTAQQPHIYAQRALKAGAEGFFSKDDDLSQLKAICELVLAGYFCFPAESLKQLKQQQPEVSQTDLITRLSDRELTVLRYLAQGISNKEIAERLLLSHKTISTYKTRLMEKLQLNSLSELKVFFEHHC